MKSNRTLSAAEIEAFGAELDQLRHRTVATLGARDATYIRRIRTSVRLTELAGRIMLFAGFFPPTFILGVLLLGVSKIIDNMELGHNVMHGQFDFMNEPEFSGKDYEWNHACPADFWRYTHNYEHHTYTNILGKDKDLGYGLVRLFPEQRWNPGFLLQPLYALLLALLFQYGVAIQHLKMNRLLNGKMSKAEFSERFTPFMRKLRHASVRDYVIFPLLAGPHFLAVLCGNILANLIRNVWTWVIIFCGHFTKDAEVFPQSVLESETRGHWYLRQVRGSSNLKGSKLFHILSGNLSHQIEHHLFPDIPANRYAELALDVRQICAKYGQHYNTGRFSVQFGTVLWRIFRYAFPGSVHPASNQPLRA